MKKFVALIRKMDYYIYNTTRHCKHRAVFTWVKMQYPFCNPKFDECLRWGDQVRYIYCTAQQ